MKLEYDINTDTPLVPYIIAERALWNTIEKDERFKDLQPMEVDKIVKYLSPVIVDKAEKIYKHDEHFRKSLADKRKDCRYTLEMFMEHWSLSLLKKYSLKLISD